MLNHQLPAGMLSLPRGCQEERQHTCTHALVHAHRHTRHTLLKNAHTYTWLSVRIHAKTVHTMACVYKHTHTHTVCHALFHMGVSPQLQREDVKERESETKWNRGTREREWWSVREVESDTKRKTGLQIDWQRVQEKRREKKEEWDLPSAVCEGLDVV